MPIQPKKYHEFDPNVDYEEITPQAIRPIDPGIVPNAVFCCQCTDITQTLCAIEHGTGEAISTTTAQMFAYWYS